MWKEGERRHLKKWPTSQYSVATDPKIIIVTGLKIHLQLASALAAHLTDSTKHTHNAFSPFEGGGTLCMSIPDATHPFIQLRRSSRNHLPLIPHPFAQYQFRQNIIGLIRTTTTLDMTLGNDVQNGINKAQAGAEAADSVSTTTTAVPSSGQTGLKKIAPYWYPYTTMAKMRWLGRELLEVVSTEFRDRSMEYYVSSNIFGL